MGKLPSICQFQGGFFAILQLAIREEECYNKNALGAWHGCRAESLSCDPAETVPPPAQWDAFPLFLSPSPFLRSDSFPLSRRPVSPGRASTRRFVPAEPRSMRCACGIGCRGAGGAKGTPPFGGVPFASGDRKELRTLCGFWGLPPKGRGYTIIIIDGSGSALQPLILRLPGRCSAAWAEGGFRY